MGLKALKPAPGEGRGVFLGVVLTLFIHLSAFIAIALIGASIERQEGALLVLPFIAFVGVTQWIYLGPIAWFLRRRGSIALMKGVLIAGGLGTLATGLCYGGIGVYSLQQVAEVKRIQQYEHDHPRDDISTKGVITAVDDTHFEFRRDDDGSIVSLQTWSGTDYRLIKKNGEYEIKTRDILSVGARVSVEYTQERGKPPVSASIVRVIEE